MSKVFHVSETFFKYILFVCSLNKKNNLPLSSRVSVKLMILCAKLFSRIFNRLLKARIEPRETGRQRKMGDLTG